MYNAVKTKTKDKIIHQILNETTSSMKEGYYSAETTETTAVYTQASQSTALIFTDTWGEDSKPWYASEHHLFT